MQDLFLTALEMMQGDCKQYIFLIKPVFDCFDSESMHTCLERKDISMRSAHMYSTRTLVRSSNESVLRLKRSNKKRGITRFWIALPDANLPIEHMGTNLGEVVLDCP